MSKLQLSIASFLVFAGAAALPTHADQLPALSWNCWLDEEAPVTVSCVHARGQPLPKGAPEDTDAELESLLQRRLAKRKSGKRPVAPDRPDWRGVDILHKGAEWKVRIRSVPAGMLQDEKRLTGLMHEALCPGNVPCEVRLRPRVQQP